MRRKTNGAQVPLKAHEYRAAQSEMGSIDRPDYRLRGVAVVVVERAAETLIAPNRSG
jgi:hypothetical protein